MSANQSILAVVVYLASLWACWWFTASHYETLALRHGAAKKIRYEWWSELEWRDYPSYGSWR